MILNLFSLAEIQFYLGETPHFYIHSGKDFVIEKIFEIFFMSIFQAGDCNKVHKTSIMLT